MKLIQWYWNENGSRGIAHRKDCVRQHAADWYKRPGFIAIPYSIVWALKPELICHWCWQRDKKDQDARVQEHLAGGR